MRCIDNSIPDRQVHSFALAWVCHLCSQLVFILQAISVLLEAFLVILDLIVYVKNGIDRLNLLGSKRTLRLTFLYKIDGTIRNLVYHFVKNGGAQFPTLNGSSG